MQKIVVFFLLPGIFSSATLFIEDGNLKKWFDTSCLASALVSLGAYQENILKTLTITMGCDMLGHPITAFKLHTMGLIHFWWCILISMQLPIFS